MPHLSKLWLIKAVLYMHPFLHQCKHVRYPYICLRHLQSLLHCRVGIYIAVGILQGRPVLLSPFLNGELGHSVTKG